MAKPRRDTAADAIVAALRTQSEMHRRWAEQGRDRRRNLRCAEVQDRLSSGDGARVRAWLIKQQFGAQLAAQAVALSLVVASSRPLTKWEERSSADRRRVLENVQRLADDLAELIDANGAPPVPMALALFDRACMPGYALAEALAVGTEPSDVPATAKLSVGLGAADVPEALRPLFDQRVGPLLRSLATWAASHKHTRPRDTRPNTGAPGARVLARRVASWVESHCTARMPATLIADIVNLAMPDLASPVTAENVKEWGKAK